MSPATRYMLRRNTASTEGFMFLHEQGNFVQPITIAIDPALATNTQGQVIQKVFLLGSVHFVFVSTQAYNTKQQFINGKMHTVSTYCGNKQQV